MVNRRSGEERGNIYHPLNMLGLCLCVVGLTGMCATVQLTPETFVDDAVFAGLTAVGVLILYRKSFRNNTIGGDKKNGGRNKKKV